LLPRSFGELALYFNVPRAATVKASAPCVCWKLDRRTFRHFVAQSRSERLEITTRAFETIDVLAALPTAHLHKIATHVKEQPFDKGATIIKRGSEGDSVYLLKEGTVLCTNIDKSYVQTRDVKLGPGSHFGEMAQVTDNHTRTCDVVAVSRCVVFELSGRDFAMLLNTHQHVAVAVRVLQTLQSLMHLDISVKELMTSFEERRVEAGALLSDATTPRELVVLCEGEAAFAPSGAAACRCGPPSKKGSKLIRLRPGDYFGERCLQDPDKWTAVERCYATTDATLFCLTQKSYEKYVQKVRRQRASQRTPPPYKDLVIKQTLGEGSFGRVKMVVHRPAPTAGAPEPESRSYALKMLSKQGMANKKQVKAILAELRVLLLITHPFLLHLHGTYQSRDLCYFLFDCIQGGELFKRLASSDDCTIPFKDAQFYASHLVEALVYLQSKRVVYRDLKPENILIDARGYARVVDFGFAKVMQDDDSLAYTLCGTPEYLSPECVLGTGYRFEIDLWAFGIIVYEMLVGYTPFSNDDDEVDDMMAIFKRITKASIEFPDALDDRTVDFVTAILAREQQKRLGNSLEGLSEVRDHHFFTGDIDFPAILAMKAPAPWTPKIRGIDDTSNFDDYDDDEDKFKEPFSGDQKQFIEFGRPYVIDTAKGPTR
jgi:serine/threonine protein kinase/CRP-like cAMP-binding protein